MENDKLMTLKESAELMTISVGTLYNWRSAGILPKLKRYKESYILDIREKWVNGDLIV